MRNYLKYLFVCFGILSFQSFSQSPSDSIAETSIRLKVYAKRVYEPVAFADVFIEQDSVLIAKGKTNFDGHLYLSFEAQNYQDSISVTILMSPYEAHTFKYLPQPNKIFIREIELKESTDEEEEVEKDDGPIIPKYVKIETSLNRGFGLGAAFGMFGVVEQGTFWDGPFLGHGIGGCLGVEANWNNNDFFLGPKLTAEYHWLGGFLGAKMSLWYLTNFDEGALKFSPEIGFSAFGFGHLMVGYNFGLTDDNISTINGIRFNLGINIPFIGV